MMILNIAIGLVGLGVVVFVHELGHLIAAKAVGIEVEAFSLGWGRKLVGISWRGTDYRISVFPIGGYCKMKGEQSFTTAVEDDASSLPTEPGTFFGAVPWRRIVTLVAGPAANLLLAIVILTIIWWVGFSVESFPSRIIVAAEYDEATETDAVPSAAALSPAESGGLQTGDVVVSIDGTDIASYSDLQQIVAQNALTALDFAVQRGERLVGMTITPELVPETGAGRIGVYAWVDPLVAGTAPGSPGAASGLRPGDLIVSVNDQPVAHTLDLGRALATAPESVELGVVRDGGRLRMPLTIAADGSIGVAFQTLTLPTPDYGIVGAVGRGVHESIRILSTSVRSLRLLFQGVELTSAVAGPVRISYFIGDVTTAGLSSGLDVALRSLFNFLALLSVVLFFMNLLPIPVLDGGQIVLAGIEWVRGRAARPRTVYRYQMVGSVLILGLLVFAVFGDILFLAGR